LIVGNNINVELPLELRVSLGIQNGMKIIDKFGSNPSLTSGDTKEYLWELGGDYSWGNDTGETLYISSSNTGDTQDIVVSVLTTPDGGTTFNEEEVTVTLEGQTQKAIVTPSGDPVVRCWRMENEADFGNDILGSVYAYYNDTVIAGVPQNQNKILAVIVNGSNQTKQLMYTIPSGYWGFLWRGEAGATRQNGIDEVDFAYKSRRFGKVFKEKKDFGVMTSGSNNYLDLRPFPDIIPPKTDLAIIKANATASNMGAWATFHILLIEESEFNKLQNT